MDAVGRIKHEVGSRRKEILIVLVIFLFAFGVRAWMMRYELPFEFDPYWHARMVSYLVQDGYVPDFDPSGYWHAQIPIEHADFFWWLAAIMYGAFSLGTVGYSQEAVIMVMKVAPALYGALAAVGAFYFIKEIYGPRPAYAAALLAAVMPAFVYRTMAGFFEPTSIGFVFITFGLYFMAKASNHAEHRDKTLLYGGLGGLMFGLMALAWKGFMFTIPIVAVSGVFMVLSNYTKKSARATVQYVASFVITLVLLFVFGMMAQSGAFFGVTANLLENAFTVIGGTGFAALAAGGVIAMAAGALALHYLIKSAHESTPKSVVTYFRLLLFISIIVVFVFAVSTGKTFSSSGVIGSSIGEESLGINYFGNKYNMLLFFSILAFAIIPIKDLLDKKDTTSATVFTLALVTMFMAWGKLKFTFLFGLPLAVSAAPTFWLVLHKVPSGFYRKAGVLFLGFCLLVGVAAGTFFMSQQFPNIEADTGWKEMLKWIPENTPPEQYRIFNWWDEGHWIGFLAERGPIIDNRNAEGEARRDVGLFLITQDENVGLSIMGQYEPDYLLFGDDLLGKQRSLGQYVYNTFSDPRIPNAFGVSFPCGREENPLSGQVTYSCGSNRISESEMNAMPTVWHNQPNTFLDQQQRNPGFVYVTPERDRLTILNAEANDTYFAKVWFHEPSTEKYFEEVHREKGVKLFAVRDAAKQYPESAQDAQTAGTATNGAAESENN